MGFIQYAIDIYDVFFSSRKWFEEAFSYNKESFLL